MFALFYSLYVAMFTGTWFSYENLDIITIMSPTANSLGKFLTSLFNNVDAPMATLGDDLFNMNFGLSPYVALVSFILALITSIGIVVMAVKGIKRIFSVFFYGVR